MRKFSSLSHTSWSSKVTKISYNLLHLTLNIVKTQSLVQEKSQIISFLQKQCKEQNIFIGLNSLEEEGKITVMKMCKPTVSFNFNKETAHPLPCKHMEKAWYRKVVVLDLLEQPPSFPAFRFFNSFSLLLRFGCRPRSYVLVLGQ